MPSKPACSFTIPSVHDDIDIECRVYHPDRFCNTGSDAQNGAWSKRGAIIAHPYAPLGGCYDDPVVLTAASIMLRHGFIVGTFNFRGAGDSKGSTSWTGHPEQEDYMSFIGFFAHYLDGISPPPPSAAPVSPIVPDPHALSPIQTNVVLPTQSPAVLVIGGYSYGSLITIKLPSIETIFGRFQHVKKGSAQAEILLRARHLSEQWNQESLEDQRRGRSLAAEIGSPRRRASNIVFGGEESDPGTRRASRDSRRSFDAVRRSVEVSRQRLSLGGRTKSGEAHRSLSATQHSAPSAHACHSTGNDNNAGDSDSNEGDILSYPAIPLPLVRYLLISPLLPPVSSLITLLLPGLSLFRHNSNSSNENNNNINSNSKEAGSEKKKSSHHNHNHNHRRRSTQNTTTTTTNTTNPSQESSSSPESKLAHAPTLAISGTKDFFTSPKKLRKWADQFTTQSSNSPTSPSNYPLSATSTVASTLTSTSTSISATLSSAAAATNPDSNSTLADRRGSYGGDNGNMFRYVEVSGAGHFWREEGVLAELRRVVGRWAGGLG